MKSNQGVLILINIFLIFNVNASENNLEESFANLWINDLDHNADIVLLKYNEQFYVECNELSNRNININNLLRLTSRNNFCLVSGDSIQSQFDSSIQAIKLTVPSTLFTSSSNILETNTVPEKASFGGFINYDLTYLNNRMDGEIDNSYNGLADLGIFKDYWIFRNSVAYQNTPAGEFFNRLSTNIDFEIPSNMTRLTLGDTTTVFNPLINSLRFAGLSWGTNYTERPNFIYWNTPALQGSARLPSTVDLYINGVSIYSQKVSPGEFNLQTGAQIQQAGNAQIVVEDVLGNRSVQSFPILVTNRLLRPDLSEYNISLGKLRYNYNIKSDDYRDFFSNFYYRRGLSNVTTLGSNFLYSDKIQNLGLMWTQAISHYVVLDSIVQASHHDNQFNYSYGLSASKDFGRFSLGASSKYTERNFKFLGDDLNEVSVYPKFEHLIYGGMSNVPVLENIFFNYAEQNYHKGSIITEDNFAFLQEDRKTFSIGFNRRLGRKATLGLSYYNSFGEERDASAILTFSYSFDDNKAIYFSHATDDNTKLQFVKSNASQVGFEYEAGVNRRNEENFYNLKGRLKTNVGDLNFYHIEGEHDGESQLNYRGGMVWLQNSLSFTKLVDNAFSIVSVGDYEDVDILRSLSVVNKTNKKGYAFIHDIIPYVNYDIGFDQNQLPIEDKIPYLSKKLTAFNQRGYIINFPVFHAKQVTVRPLDINNKTFIAGSELHIDNDGGEVYPISSDGTVTLYGLIPKTYNVKIKTNDSKTCSAQLMVTENPNTADKVVNLNCK